MLRRRLPLAVVAVLALASCTDSPTRSDALREIPDDLLSGPSLSILDGANGQDGNPHFFWLKPLGDSKRFDGVADGSLFPTVEVCLRNTAGDGCASGAPLASFERDEGPDRDRIQVDDKDQYFVQWRMNDHPPTRDAVYRIRVVYQEQEFGHVDVVALRANEMRAYSAPAGDEILAISDRGTVKIAFRIEEGALQDQFCDFDGDGDVEDCDAQVEIAGDGVPTQVQVTGSSTGGGTEVAAVVTAPDGVFLDGPGGEPIENVVLTAEVELLPPSEDVFTDNTQELPYFVEINTFPENVYVDPSGPGIAVVVCQDEAVLTSRGITTLGLMNQLVLYKVSDPQPGFPDGVTQRLATTVGAPECGAPVPAPGGGGLASLLRRGARMLGAMVGPEPLRATFLHGGLNTVSSTTSLGTFSTFGAALGPNADSSQAVVPDGEPGVPTQIVIQLENALGQNLALAGDTLKPEVYSGPNTGASFTVTDQGGGLYTAEYTPQTAGVDSIRIELIRADGPVLGYVAGRDGVTLSGYPSAVVAPAPATTVLNTNDSGANSLRAAILAANAAPGPDVIDFDIPGAGPHLIALTTPLPNITDAVVLDGESQPGYAGTPLVQVDGAVSGGSGFQLFANDVVVRGLAVTSFNDGVFVSMGASNATVSGNHLGTNGAGAGGLGNNVGVRVYGSGATVTGNVISGNAGAGVLLASPGNDLVDAVVQNNRIGTTPDGLQALGNGTGVNMFGSPTGQVVDPLIIGNLVSGNTGMGVDIQHSGSLQQVTGATLHDNVIGLDANGGALGNGAGGVRANNAPGTVVGEAGLGNVISANGGIGVHLIGPTVSPAATVAGNIIGLDPTGTAARGNTVDGIHVATSNVVIGGPASGDRNIISGNDSDGVETSGSATGVLVEGNWVGLDATGTAAIGNGFVSGACCKTGIFIRTGGNTARGNVVSGNWLGIRSGDPGGAANLIENNLVGTDASGTADLGNQNDGIGLYGDKSGTQVRGNTVRYNGTGIALVEGTEDALVGGTGPGDGNVVSDNDGIGVRVGYNPAAGDVRNTIRRNAISGNGGLGIDLAGDGITANDALDADGGPNGRVNRPEILSVNTITSPAQTVVQLHLDAEPFTSYDVEFFGNATCHPSGAGEGATPIVVHSAQATFGSGQITLTVYIIGAQPAGSYLTATATDPDGNTSEFSDCAVVGAPLPDINAALPDTAAAGFGQMITLEGADFPASPTVSFTQGATTLNGFVYAAGSSQIVVRLPTSGLSSSVGGVPTTVEVSGSGVTSNAVNILTRIQPGTPLVIQMQEGSWTGSCTPAGLTATDGTLVIGSGGVIAVQAYGLDTSSAEIRLVQGSNTWTRSSLCAFYAPSAAYVQLPGAADLSDTGAAVLADGAAQVQVRTTVNGVPSAWSAPIAVTIDVP